MNPLVQILVQQYGLSPAQAEAYIGATSHPSMSVAAGSVMDAAKIRAMHEAIIAERDRAMAGQGDSELNRRGALQADFPDQAVKQQNLDNKAIGASHDLRALAQSYDRPVGQIDMPVQDAYGVQPREGLARRRSGLSKPPGHDHPQATRQRLAVLEHLAQRGTREGLTGLTSWLPGSHPPGINIGDVTTQDMPLDIGNVTVTNAPPPDIVGDVTVTSKKR